MEEKHFRHIILYYFKKDKKYNGNPKKKKKMCMVYREGATADEMC